MKDLESPSELTRSANTAICNNSSNNSSRIPLVSNESRGLGINSDNCFEDDTSSQNRAFERDVKAVKVKPSKKEKNKKDKSTRNSASKFKLFDVLIKYFEDNVVSMFKEPVVSPENPPIINTDDLIVSSEPSGHIGSSSEAKELSYVESKHPNRKVPLMTWEQPVAIDYLTPLSSAQLNATCCTRGGRKIEGNIVYMPTVNAILPAGVHSLRAVFIPKYIDRYENVEKEVTLEVKRAHSDVIWNTNVEELLYGTPLPSELFCAECINGVIGTFEYTASPGQVLQRGRLRIDCKFIPVDRDNYSFGYAHHFLQITACPVTLRWPELRKVVYGNALRKDFLHTAQVVEYDAVGQFTYEPSHGVVYDAGKHEFVATFTPNDLTMYHTTRIKNTLEVLRCRPILEWNQPISLFDGAALTEQSLNCTCINVPSGGVFVYDPPLGTILKVGIHLLKVKFFPNDSTNYEPATAEQEQSIFKKVTPVIYWAEGSALTYPAYLSKVQLNASISGLVPGTLVYDPPVDTLLPAGQHRLSVTFYPNDPGKTTASKSVNIYVHKGVAKLQWNTPLSILEGQPLSHSALNAFSTNCENGGKFVYEPSAGTILKPGKHVLHCSFTPTDSHNFIGAEITTTIEVKSRVKTKPEVSWDQLDQKYTYPYPLSRKELNATGNVYGTFRYDPPASKVLPVGRHMLEVTLFPQNTDSYVPASTHNFIEIIKGVPELEWEPFSLIYSQEIQEHHLSCKLKESRFPIEGTFSYDVDIGDILPAGTHNIACRFEPKDKFNYYSAKISIEVKVARAYPIIKWEQPASVIYPAYIDVHMHLNPKIITPNILPGKYPKLKPTEDNSTLKSVKSKKSEPVLEPYLVGEFKFSHSSGTILDVGTYEITCRFYPKDIANFFSVDSSITYTVTPGRPQITWNVPYSITFGELVTDRELCATSDVDSDFIYDPPLGTLLPCGELLSLRCQVIPKTNFNYCKIALIRNLSVKRRTPVLSWKPPTSITYGTPLGAKELCAHVCSEKNDEFMVKELEEGTFSYSPSFGELLDVGSDLPLTVLFVPPATATKSYTAAGLEVTIKVVKFQPTITWDFPLASCQIINGNAGFPTISYGDALSDYHLCATVDRPIGCDISGRFEYNPPKGTILPVGRKLLSVVWYPDSPELIHECKHEFYVEIIKRTPKIIWSDPLPIVAGTPLSRRELNAKMEFSDAEGFLEYEPPLHTCLFHPGKYDLTVKYEPHGIHACRSFHKAGPVSVQIAVLPRGSSSRPSSPERMARSGLL